MTRTLALVTLLVLLPAVALASHPQAEQTEREEALMVTLVDWPVDRPPDAAVLADVEALTTASLEWLDSLTPAECWIGWWAAIRTSWELTAVAVRLARAEYPSGTIMNVFRGVGMTRQVGMDTVPC